MSQIEGKIVTFFGKLDIFPKDLRTILTHLSRQVFTHFFDGTLEKSEKSVKGRLNNVKKTYDLVPWSVPYPNSK